jgi:hypothetical protein
MNNEKHYYATPFLFEEDIHEIKNAIVIAQNYWGDKRTGTLDWNDYYQARIEQLERIFNKLDSATFKELPEPPKEI